MSTAHSLLDDDLMPEAEFRRFLSSHPEIIEDVENDHTISHAFDLPYGAGYNVSGDRDYIDRHVPLIWSLKRKTGRVKVHIVKYPIRHERFESACIRLLSMDYETAHHYATRAEHNLLTSDGYDWLDYERQWKPLIKADETESIQRVPPDLDLTPYEGTPLLPHLRERMSRHSARALFRRKRSTQ